MTSVQIEQKNYEMPPREGISIAHFLTVADVERSARCYEKVVGARILTMGDGNAPPYLQLANIWTILNVSWIGTCPITALIIAYPAGRRHSLTCLQPQPNRSAECPICNR